LHGSSVFGNAAVLFTVAAAAPFAVVEAAPFAVVEAAPFAVVEAAPFAIAEQHTPQYHRTPHATSRGEGL
jgi:hypothetical protein